MAVAVAVAGSTLGGFGAGGPTRAEAQSTSTLEGFLLSRGFTKVPLMRLPTGHFSVGGTAADVSLEMILDTGASHTVLDVGRAERFGLMTENRGGRASGVGLESQSVETGWLEDVEIGPVRLDDVRVSVLDLSEVNRVLAQLGNAPIDGIIGADVLMARSAVIDYGTLSVYLRD